MTTYSIDGWMVAYEPLGSGGGLYGPWEGEIEVGPHPDKTGWSDRYTFTSGCCWMDRHSMSLEGKIMMMLIDFHTAVVRDGIDPARAHCEFLKIDEYRRRIAPDIQGAMPEARE